MRRPFMVVLVFLLALAVVASLPGCRPGRVRFIDCTTNARSITRADGEDPPAPAEFEISQLNTVCGIETRSVRADAGGTPVEIRPAGVYDCASITPEEGALMLSVEGLEGGTAVIETVDGTAALPVVVYDHYIYGGWHGIIVSAGNTKQLTQVRADAHFWSEWREEYHGTDWKALVPMYCADESSALDNANRDRLAAVKTVDIERLTNAPVGQWLEAFRIYIARVPDGYVKIQSTSEGLFWIFSPTPKFP
jgi:hypothetical protein